VPYTVPENNSVDKGNHPMTMQRPSPLDALSVTIYMRDLAGGGVERQTLALASELQANGLKVTLLLHKAVGELLNSIPANIAVVDLNSRRTLQDIPLIARFLRRERPDVLLANLDHNNVAAILANQLAGRPSKVVICQHNPVAEPYFWSLNWSYRLIPMAYVQRHPELTP
jgi:hypothetical protein